MTRARWTLVGTGVVCAALTTSAVLAERPADALPRANARPSLSSQTFAPSGGTATLEAPDDVIAGYCRGCHNDMMMRGGLSLASFNVADAMDNPVTAEKMIRKLQAGMMPPPGEKRPDISSYLALIDALESTVDAAAAANPNPGSRTFPRLNRPEYEMAIEDLLALKVDAGDWLPLDQKSANFDNIADEQVLSAILLEAYLNAAADISRLAVGDRNAPSLDKTYANSSYLSQHPWNYVEGAPYGTRGGMVVDHVFPADAEYEFGLTIVSGNNSLFEDLDISIDGERVALVRYEQGQVSGQDGRGGVDMQTEPIVVTAGQHRLAAAFVRRTEGPYEDLIRPNDWSYSGGGSGGVGITTIPHLRHLVVRGPNNAIGVSETASRRKIFSCRPTSLADETPCAREIVMRLGSAAYRRPMSERELDMIMQFYDTGAAEGGFEVGVRTVLEAVLASPHFIFRLEERPDGVAAGEIYPVGDLDLASRLSFFLWGAPPDDELMALAERGALNDPATLDAQTERMLADPRADALGPRFAAQWLRLQDVDKVHPDPNYFPNFDSNLAEDMKRETELFFNHLVDDDASVLELFGANFTFVNERLALHYGVPGVAGAHFRRVTYPDDRRRGVLGHGSMLVQSSLANRTSPVLRGKWVMEVLMGTPPPPPPPDVPALEETGETQSGKQLTTRERMEIHRANPTCNSCHRFMDPIGLALDNFDVTGKWREHETGMPLDTSGDFYDGTAIASPAELSAALLKRPVPLVRNFTENLMAYAMGRRIEYFDQPTVRAIANAAESQNYRISAFIKGIVASDAFRMQRADATVLESGGR